MKATVFSLLEEIRAGCESYWRTAEDSEGRAAASVVRAVDLAKDILDHVDDIHLLLRPILENIGSPEKS